MSQEQSTQQVTSQIRTPNQYHLHGGGIAVSYFPDGFGPVIEGRGRLTLIYQDSQRSVGFYGSDVRVVEVPDLGAVVSVTLHITVDFGSTTFSVLIPDVGLTGPIASVPISTEGITTFHRLFIIPIGHGQRETYTVTPLTGTASIGPLPL